MKKELSDMKKPLFQKETRVWRTYKGGKMLDAYLGKDTAADTAYPEDWISSFVEAKNINYIEGEGITTVMKDGAAHAAYLARKTLSKVYRKVGFTQPK